MGSTETERLGDDEEGSDCMERERCLFLFVDSKAVKEGGDMGDAGVSIAFVQTVNVFEQEKKTGRPRRVFLYTNTKVLCAILPFLTVGVSRLCKTGITHLKLFWSSLSHRLSVHTMSIQCGPVFISHTR